jgi:hypothetical protein
MTELENALARGEDATGLCTLRDMVKTMKEYAIEQCEVYFEDDGKRWNAEVKITRCVPIDEINFPIKRGGFWSRVWSRV